MRTPKDLSALLKKEMKQKNLRANQMLTDLEINENFFSSMSNRGSYPRVEPLVSVANYLNLSLDYLLDTECFQKTELTSEVDSNNCIISNSNSNINGNNNVISNAPEVNKESANEPSEIERELLSVFNSLSFVDKADVMKYIADKKCDHE